MVKAWKGWRNEGPNIVNQAVRRAPPNSVGPHGVCAGHGRTCGRAGGAGGEAGRTSDSPHKYLRGRVRYKLATTSVYYECGEETLLSLILLYVCGTTSGFSGTSRGCIYYRSVVGCSGKCYIHSTLHSVSALTRTDKH